MNNTKKLPTTGIKPTIESFFAISVCHFRDQRECRYVLIYLSKNARQRLVNLILVPLPALVNHSEVSFSLLVFIKSDLLAKRCRSQPDNPHALFISSINSRSSSN